MAKLVTNTVKKKFTFRLTYADDGAVRYAGLLLRGRRKAKHGWGC